ncbi:Cytochrome P450 6j1, partial [Blattella germanica]
FFFKIYNFFNERKQLNISRDECESTDLSADSKPMPVKDLLSRYTADIISSFAFGVESSSLLDPKAEFSRMMMRMYKLPFLQAFANLTTCFAPWIHSTFKIKVLEPEIEDYLREAVMSSVRFSFTLYELALNPDIQKRVRDEVKEVLDKNNNEVTYDVVQEMKYLDMVLCETMRRHPSIPTVDRRCREDWSHPSGVKLRAGTPVYIPIYALHHDPLYFPNPEKFDPERFTDENKQKIPHFAYMPFGEGPRSCPGKQPINYTKH